MSLPEARGCCAVGRERGETVRGQPASQWAEFFIFYCFRSFASLLPSIGVYNCKQGMDLLVNRLFWLTSS